MTEVLIMLPSSHTHYNSFRITLPHSLGALDELSDAEDVIRALSLVFPPIRVREML